MRKLIQLLLLGGALCLMGCGSTQPLYYHGNYAQNLYAHFKAEGSSPEEQILALEETIEKANAANLVVAPGLYAHLGYLYTLTGQMDKGLGLLEQEKALFPESATYIDFLINNAKGVAHE
jgi:hypothetical protein